MNGVLVLGSTGRLLVEKLCAIGRDVDVIHRSETRRAEFESLGARVLLSRHPLLERVVSPSSGAEYQLIFKYLRAGLVGWGRQSE